MRAITIIPSPDQLAFAVTEKTGLKSLHEIRERRMPLRVSVRGQRDHALHPITHEVLKAVGFSLDDIVSWGGQVRYDDGLPMKSNRFGAMQRGEVDMIIDEAVRGWANSALDAGMRILPLDEACLTKMEALGLRRGDHAGGALSQVGQGFADVGFQRLRGLHPCRCAGRSDHVDLRRVGSAQGTHRLARARAAAVGKRLPRHRRRAVGDSVAPGGGKILARAGVSVGSGNFIARPSERQVAYMQNTVIAPDATTDTVRGFCALCTAHCATIATVTDGKVVRLEADADHPNGGVFCLKGKAAPELVYHPDRLNYPLKRTRPKGDSDPGWQRVSWDEALDDIAQRLNAIRERYGARAVALAKGTGGGTSVSDAERWLARLLNRFGSPNWTSTTHVCNWHKDTGFTYTFGVEIPTPDVAHSGAFLLWGHNPSSTSLILAHDIVAARKRGMKIVAVDPRRVGIAAQADVLLQVRPGTDGALALAMIDVAIKEKLFDDSFVRQWTNGTFLIRLDTGAALTEADLTASGSADRFVAWDEIANAPIVYDSVDRQF